MEIRYVQEVFNVADRIEANKTFKVECEARFTNYVNEENLNRLTSYFSKIAPFSARTYHECKKPGSSSNQKYRRRVSEDGSVETICKSRLLKRKLENLWCDLILSSEIECSSPLEGYSKPERVSRGSAIYEGCLIEIGSSSGYWLEVERIPGTAPEKFLSVIGECIRALTNSKETITRTDWYVLDHILKTHLRTWAKPVTLTTKNLNNILSCKWVSPKYDGSREFCIIRLGYIFKVGLKRDSEDMFHSKSKVDISLETTILDCEVIDCQTFVMDVPVYDGKYIGSESIARRMNLKRTLTSSLQKCLPESLYAEKVFERFHNPCQIIDTYRDSKVPCDGAILMQGDYNNVYKWKPHNTIDLFVKRDGLYTSDKIKVSLNLFPDHVGNICEFLTKGERFPMELSFVRERQEKPRANPLKIVEDNVYHNIDSKIFQGEGCYFMRKYHNKIKRDLLKKYFVDGNLIDIGTGQGGDISKWSKYRKVYCIEPNEKIFNERKNPHKHICEYIKSRGEKDFGLPKAGTVSAFFCINLFTQQDVAGLIKLLDKDTAPKSYFIGIVLSNLVEDDNPVFVSKIISGREYSLSLKNTRISEMKENQVSVNMLEKAILGIGFSLKDKNILNQGILLSDEERTLSSMYEYFVFSKGF